MNRQPDSPLPATVVDPVPAFRSGLGSALLSAGFDVQEPEDLEAWVAQHRSSLVVVCIENHQAIAKRLSLDPSTLVMGLVSSANPYQHSLAAQLGCQSAVSRKAAVDRIVAAAVETVKGHVLVPQSTWKALARQRPPPERLCEEQMQILSELATGITIAELADRQGYSRRQMYRRLHGLYRNLNVNNRSQALVVAASRGLLAEGDAAGS